MPKLVVIQPNWKKESEVWLLRMNDMLKDHIKAIFCFAPNEKEWNGIPIFDLYGQKANFFQKVLHRLQIKSYSVEYYVQKHLSRIISAKDVEVILVHFPGPALQYQGILKRSGKEIFIYMHGAGMFVDSRTVNSPEQLSNPKAKETLLGLSEFATFIANSRYTFNTLIDIGIPEDKIRVKYFGVPIGSRKLHKEKKITILYLGRLVDFKGPDLVIQAFILACQKGLNARLIVAGDGYMRYTCELLKRRSVFGDRITFVGATSKETSEELFLEADIFTAHNCFGTLSHHEETFGVTMLEAMAHGLPVINTNNSAIPESIIHNETGFLVEPFDLEAHAEAFILLANNVALRNKMGEAGQKHVAKNFSLEQEQKALFKVLNLK